MVQIRAAEPADFQALTAIYNEIVRSSTAVYNDAPASVEERLAWWDARRASGYPVLVVEQDGDVLGFASFGDFRPWPGYRYTVEGTIHLRPDARRQGVGQLLLDELVVRARALGKHMLVAGVDAENQASLHFLERYGFRRAGCLREVGYKFGRYLDLCFLQLALTDGNPGEHTSSAT